MSYILEWRKLRIRSANVSCELIAAVPATGESILFTKREFAYTIYFSVYDRFREGKTGL